MKHAVLSRKFIEALRLHPDPAYRIAWRADIHPNTLSKLCTGYLRPRLSDERVLAVAREIGLSAAECFDPIDDSAPLHESSTPLAARG